MKIYEINGKRAIIVAGMLFVEVEPVIDNPHLVINPPEETEKPATHRHYKKRKASTEEDDGVSAFPPKKQRTCSLCHKPGHRADRCGVKGSVKVAKVRESFDGDDDE